MSITPQAANAALQRIANSSRLQVLFAQAHARRVLVDVGESTDNFPPFDQQLDDKVTIAAYEIISAGCVLAEEGQLPAARAALEQGAVALDNVHRHATARSSGRAFHILVAAMAFYAAGQYSRAFIAIKTVEGATPAAVAIAGFLRRDARAAIAASAGILLREDSEPRKDAEINDLYEAGIEKAIARAIHLALEFSHGGISADIDAAAGCVDDALIIATELGSPSWWYVSRLLRLILADLREASPWTLLPPYFPGAGEELARYIRLHTLARRPAWELWRSQRDALGATLQSGAGIVLNLRTSGGKTRLAELAILRVLLADPSAKVLYLAPFRSLALEVEETLAQTLGVLGYQVSHLYGGSRVSVVDTRAADDADIMIATPEKARALMRAVPELDKRIKLVIVDEGHLLGIDPRLVRNEMFLDHLRILSARTGARIVLLSAVLPNAEELAAWIGGSAGALAKSDWKPSGERRGTLLWDGTRVRLDWQGKATSFNPSFVVRKKVKLGTTFEFPRNKNEAVAATAVRLSASGPVLIFSARANSIPGLAKAALLAAELQKLDDFAWPEHEWRVFEAVCREDLLEDSIEYRAARKGIVCHHAQLPPQVRSALERLMRASPARLVIATSTLAQGVNIGVCTVIVASAYPGKEPMPKRDFWNICGRAGRAFVDGEGRVLYALDSTKRTYRQQRRLADEYLNGTMIDDARSGVLLLAEQLYAIARQANVSFERLVELVAEDDAQELGELGDQVERSLDLVDDELLALHSDLDVNVAGGDDVGWVDAAFRQSLAALQASSSPGPVDAEGVIRLLTARTGALLRRHPGPDIRASIVGSSLPVSAAVATHALLPAFKELAMAFSRDEGDPLVALESFVGGAEQLLRSGSLSTLSAMPDEETLDQLRPGWMAGTRLRVLCEDEKSLRVVASFYGYELPWALHAVAQQMRESNEVAAKVLDDLALLVEVGVPSELAALIYLAGVRGRAAATEIAAAASEPPPSMSVSSVGSWLVREAERIRGVVSASAAEWLDLVRSTSTGAQSPVARIPPFTLVGTETAEELHARLSDDGQVYLCSPDLRLAVEVAPSQEWPFGAVANDPRVWFVRNDGGAWEQSLRDPRLAD